MKLTTENQLILQQTSTEELPNNILSKLNSSDTKKDCRKTCLLNEKTLINVGEIYQEYTDDYRQNTSLYLIKVAGERANLIIYDTENRTEEEEVLDFSELLGFGTVTTQLPNGELFCYGLMNYSGSTLIIDRNYKVHKLPSGKPCKFSSAIYFNRSVYCFGGENNYQLLAQSMRFDLDRRRWIQLTSMPEADLSCSSVIFNGKILISGHRNKNILIYSVAIDSFSTIYFNFGESKRKIFTKTERLYLFTCEKDWKVYESEIGDEYAWKLILDSEICQWPSQFYCSYNKEALYIGIIGCSILGFWEKTYYKFSLNEKTLIELSKIKL